MVLYVSIRKDVIIQIICKHTSFLFSTWHIVFHYQTQVPPLFPRTFRVSLWKCHFLLLSTAIADSPIQLLFAKQRMFFIATSFICTFLPNSRVSDTNSVSIPALLDTTALNLHGGMRKQQSHKFQHRNLREGGIGVGL